MLFTNTHASHQCHALYVKIQSLTFLIHIKMHELQQQQLKTEYALGNSKERQYTELAD